MIAGLRDRIDIIAPTMVEDPYSGETTLDWSHPVTVASDVPAAVQYATVATLNTDGRNALIEELRAIIGPRAFSASNNRIVWQGVTYQTDGVMVRRFNAADHHLVIPLKLVSG